MNIVRNANAVMMALVVVTLTTGCLQAPESLPSLTDTTDVQRVEDSTAPDGGGPGDLGTDANGLRDLGDLDAFTDLGDITDVPVVDAGEDAPSPGPEWASVSVGDGFSCGITTDKSLYCWGSNTVGQLGALGVTTGLGAMSSVPVRIGSVTDQWQAVDTGVDHACALNNEGRVFCWGSNAKGAVHTMNTQGGFEGRPTLAVDETGSVIAVGDAHTCMIVVGGSVICWGDNSDGQVGGDMLSPMKKYTVPDTSNAAALSLGAGISCMLDGSGKAFCWGGTINNSHLYTQPSCGESCDVTVTSPEPAGYGSTFSSFSVGYDHACAIKDDGTPKKAWCWGSNLDPVTGTVIGKYGHESTLKNRLLTEVEGMDTNSSVRQVSAGKAHSCAIDESGALWCWGDNSTGALGRDLGVDTWTHEAGQVVGSWKFVSAGAYATCAIEMDGSLWCWGRNSTGELGLGDTDDRDVPTRVTVR